MGKEHGTTCYSYSRLYEREPMDPHHCRHTLCNPHHLRQTQNEGRTAMEPTKTHGTMEPLPITLFLHWFLPYITTSHPQSLLIPNIQCHLR